MLGTLGPESLWRHHFLYPQCFEFVSDSYFGLSHICPGVVIGSSTKRENTKRKGEVLGALALESCSNIKDHVQCGLRLSENSAF